MSPAKKTEKSQPKTELKKMKSNNNRLVIFYTTDVYF